MNVGRTSANWLQLASKLLREYLYKEVNMFTAIEFNHGVWLVQSLFGVCTLNTSRRHVDLKLIISH